MTRTVWVAAMALAFCVSTTHLNAEMINGKVVDASGKAMEGVTISAFDEERQQSISVFSQADGSFEIDGLRDVKLKVRARLMGQLDEWQEDVDA
ncbi:MAG: carboxypeptidase-like regulatory domain-containing protein, partial [Proteobacteria bacterium]|nr:carboxypeptidase-like regulatory domain-containing protein [Pseudomonadota bacterium]